MQLQFALLLALLSLTLVSSDNITTYTININDTQGSLLTLPNCGNINVVANPMGSVGDMNGDGIDDMFVTCPSFNFGAVYVIYGRKGGIDPNLNLANLTHEQGFAIYPPSIYAGLGEAIAPAGDVNGDGLADLITMRGVVTGLKEALAGEVYVIYGKKGGIPDIYLNQTNITGDIGFTIHNVPVAASSDAKILVSKAGDVNGDGNDDILIGAPFYLDLGAVLVVYGRKGNLPDMDFQNVTSDQAALITSPTQGLYFGKLVAPAGDVNGDGIDDFLATCIMNDEIPWTLHSYIYVIYGSKNFADFSIGSFNSSLGFVMIGDPFDGNFPLHLSARGGDINADGINDIIILYRRAFRTVRSETIYVIYGTRNIRDQILLWQFPASDGVRIVGAEIDYEGGVSGVGDVNGDGVDDIIIGDYSASTETQAYTGAAYVLYGNKNGLQTPVELTTLERDQGYRILGPGKAQDWFGYRVNPAGDLNGDGINDMVIQLVRTDIAYVVYGTRGNPTSKKNNEQISL